MPRPQYNHQEIEKKWRKRHADEKLYEVDLTADSAEKYYVLDMFPYPSGYGLHVGHWRGYILSDVYARHARLHGKTVLHPMGFDAFGLNAENAAIKHKSHPKKFTDEAIASIKPQLEQMGTSFDWTKYLSTSDPSYYRWTQWLFLQFFKKGLAEKRKSFVNWCPQDQTVLANEQVVNGCCERCGTIVTKKELEQWYIKATHFADELLAGLDAVNWPERIKALQRDWIGRSEGTEVMFQASGHPIAVFTTRVDTIYGVTALVLAPEHPLVEQLTASEQKTAVQKYLETVRSKTNIDRQQTKESEKTAVFTGSYAVHPLTEEQIPVWIADYVLMEYGTGAVMSVPAHDDRDFQFATTHHLPIKQVISPKLVQSTEPAKYRPDQPVINGESVIVFIKHPTEDKYLGLNWKEKAWGARTLLTGTIDDLTPEETVIKEISEETGYIHAKISKKLGVIDGLFYHLPKQTNKLVRGHVFLVELSDEKKKEIATDEAARHDLQWLTADELATFLTPASHIFALRWLKAGFLPYEPLGSLCNSGQFDHLDSAIAAEKIIDQLEKQKIGQKKTTYRLRDWLVSRQRYWGAPIPIVYDPHGKPHPVKDEHLPLLLPEDVDFLPGGQSPIARSHEFIERAEKLYGKGWRFETDTLDTFVDSSWYYLRYLTPSDTTQAFDKQLVKKWLPVDLYVGGVEHATLHLLYGRVVSRFLATNSYIDSSLAEPFQELFGIRHITMHGAKMSKTKGNVVSPDLLVEHYGIDALRGYELFIGPLDVEADWNSRGINGVHRFLIKLFQLQEKVTAVTTGDEYFAQYLATINEMIADYRLNTVVSEAMKLVNVWFSEPAISREAFRNFLITLSPIFPFITEELWENSWQVEGNYPGSVHLQSWPKDVVKNKLQAIPILIDQKFITNFVAASAKDEAKTIEQVQQMPVVIEKLGKAKVIRVIYRPGKMVNIITKG